MPLRLRFHKIGLKKESVETSGEFNIAARRRSRFHNQQYGLTIFTMEPQQRTMFFQGQSQPRKVWLPHLAFIFQYRKIPGDNYFYGGFYDVGLRVVARNTPFTSVHNVFCVSPTETRPGGLCCTPHNYDGNYSNLNVLFGTIFKVWWGLNHNWIPFWDRKSRDEILAYKWFDVFPRKRNSFAKLYPEISKENLINETVAPFPV